MAGNGVNGAGHRPGDTQIDGLAGGAIGGTGGTRADGHAQSR